MDKTQVTVCRAYAKVNLALGILGRRPDGYHEVSTVMAPVQVFDLFSVDAVPWVHAQVPPNEMQITVTCPVLPDLPPEKNLAHKAATTFMRAVGASSRVSIHIDKRIPTKAGMGGGSSDAAGVLVALNNLVPRSMALDVGAIANLAARLGADVPFFLGCNSLPPLWEGALCSGIGERVVPVSVPRMWIVVAIPRNGVETREAYRRWDEAHSVDALVDGTEQADIRGDERTRRLLDALKSGDPAEVGRCLYNDLEDAVRESNSEIDEVKQRLLEYGALGSSMTGSGSAVFGIAASEIHAHELADRMDRVASDLLLREIVVTRTGVDRDAC